MWKKIGSSWNLKSNFALKNVKCTTVCKLSIVHSRPPPFPLVQIIKNSTKSISLVVSRLCDIFKPGRCTCQNKVYTRSIYLFIETIYIIGLAHISKIDQSAY